MLGIVALLVGVVELAWLGLIAYLVLRLLRAAFPEVPR